MGACVAIFYNLIVSFFIIFIIVMTFREESFKLLLLIKAWSIIILCIWSLYFLCMLFSKTIIITENDITIKRREKTLWSLKREDIFYCTYQKMNLFNFIIPDPNAGTMMFKLKKTNKYYKNGFSISLKNAEEIIKHFDYKINIIGSIYQQK